jgi:hypothetical protein
MRFESLHPSTALVFACALGSLASACAPDSTGTDRPDQVRAQIEAQIARTVDATRRQDIDAYMATFTPDFEETADDGDQGKLADLRAHALRDWAIIPATRDIWARIDSLGPVAGDTVVVYTNQRWDRLMLERDGVTRDTVVTTQKHRELWRRTKSGWRLSRVKELGGTVMVNGKPYPQ